MHGMCRDDDRGVQGYSGGCYHGWGRALTVEGPEVVVPQVHQVLQGGVETAPGCSGVRGQGEEGRGAAADGMKDGPQDQVPLSPSEKPDLGEPALEPWSCPES